MLHVKKNEDEDLMSILSKVRIVYTLVGEKRYEHHVEPLQEQGNCIG